MQQRVYVLWTERARVTHIELYSENIAKLANALRVPPSGNIGPQICYSWLKLCSFCNLVSLRYTVYVMRRLIYLMSGETGRFLWALYYERLHRSRGERHFVRTKLVYDRYVEKFKTSREIRMKITRVIWDLRKCDERRAIEIRERADVLQTKRASAIDSVFVFNLHSGENSSELYARFHSRRGRLLRHEILAVHFLYSEVLARGWIVIVIGIVSRGRARS